MRKLTASTTLAALLLTSQAFAQEEQEDQRTLKGHKFIYPVFSDSAFNSSHFNFSQGFVLTNVQNFRGKEKPLTVLGLEEKLYIGLRLHDRIGIFGSAQGYAVSGFRHSDFLYFFGENATRLEWGLNLIPYIDRNNGRQFGVQAKMERSSANMLELDTQSLTFGLDAIDKLNNQVFSDTEVKMLGAGGSLNAAQAFGRHFSLQASVDLMSGRKTSESSKKGTPEVEKRYTKFGIGSAFTADLMPYLPIGLQAEYHLQALTDMPTVHFLGGGLYFTKKNDFTLGVGAGKQIVEGQNSTRGQALVRYFF
ncbi:hypothetical protein HY772_06070 [Candidatus Woesearchaeota archaeon]|nr:hypothetical protein [Candidatus Woesearchaeota archaeon]